MRLLPIILLVSSTATLPAFFQTPPSGQDGRSDKPDSQSGKQDARSDTAATADAKQIDTFLATWLVVDGNNSLELAQLAQQRATDPEVKAFAQKMVDEHRPFLQKLEPFAGGTSSGALGRSDQPNQGQPNQNQPNPNQPKQNQPNQAQNASFHQGDSFDHVGLIKDLGTQCLTSSRKELESKQGAEFDRCFMGMAVVGHMRANDMLIVFQEYASGPLDAVLSEGQRTISTHLQKAKDGARKLESKAVSVSDTNRK